MREKSAPGPHEVGGIVGESANLLGRKIVGDQQAFTVLDHTLCGLVVFCAVGCDEEVEGGFGVGPGLGHPAWEFRGHHT